MIYNFSTTFHNYPKFFQKFLDEIVCDSHFPFLQEISLLDKKYLSFSFDKIVCLVFP